VSPLTLLFLFLAGFSGGFIDAVAGGGGLITMPALLACGFSPQVALGTNKLQSSFGTTLAVWRYARAGLMGSPWVGLAIAAAFVASTGGALAVSSMDKALLQKLIPWMLAGVAIYTAANPRFGLHAAQKRMGWWSFAVLFGIVLGFYDGFFGPGTGTFWTVACVALLGLDLRRATAYTKAANLASNFGSLVVFLPNGSVHFVAAAAMIAGQLIGAQAGSGFVIKHGAKFIRPVFLAVVFALTAKLIWDAVRH
jgi:uncharacterized membrane protein YfcA